MSTKEFTIKNYYEQNIPIDDGMDGDQVAAGATFPIRIRRFTVAQLKDFTRGFERTTSRSSDRYIFRKPDGDEQAFRPNGVTYVVPDSEIERRRVLEMSPETRAAYDAASLADDAFNVEFYSQSITDHIWLPPGVTIRVENEDGTEVEVRDGAGLVTAFCGNYAMLVRLARAIYEENVLSPTQKKSSRSQSGLTPSSPLPAAAAVADGATPAATVASAGPVGSAASGDASVDQDLIPSGSGGLVSAT